MGINGRMNDGRTPLIVALIPAYNEEATISRVVTQTKMHVDRVIVCDDGSTDKTSEIARSSGATVVKHKRNMGYGASLGTLFREARRLDADVAVTLDADGQHDPTHITKLLEPIVSNGTDVVIGSRFIQNEAESNLPPYRRVGIRFITLLTKRASYVGITDAQSGFRAYNRKALETIQPTRHGMGASTEILIKAKQANLAIKEVPVTISYETKTAARSPVVQWAQVVLSTLRLVSTRRPKILYGVPSVAALIMSMGLWISVSVDYARRGLVYADQALVALGASIIGIVLALIATILWMAVNAAEEVQTATENPETQ